MTLRTLNYGNSGIFLLVGNSGFIPSAVETLGSEKRTRFVLAGFRAQGVHGCLVPPPPPPESYTRLRGPHQG